MLCLGHDFTDPLAKLIGKGCEVVTAAHRTKSAFDPVAPAIKANRIP